MDKKKLKWKLIKAFLIDVMIAFISIVGIICTISILFGKQIKEAINYVDMISINKNNKVVKDIKFDEQENKITTYPEYGTRYGNIKIDSLNINLPLYYGDKLEYLRNGIGQSSGAYFPGEGGTIICMGHNTKTFLYHLPEIQNDEFIQIDTTYGNFRYRVFETKTIGMNDIDALEIQKNEEVLMLYTCYPVDTFGDKKERFLVSARRIEE